jgi:two-component system, OmpR family, response regulator VicR
VQTILVVDDEFGVVEVLTAALEDEGYRVVTAANGRHGLERLKESTPDLVILDFMMPILDGPSMAKAMKADALFAKIPIVMTSAVSESALRERFDAYDAFLRKPFRADVLIKLLKTLLGTPLAQ